MDNNIKKGIYRHFKGNYYVLEDIATCSENLEEYVVYRAMYGDNKLWIRPLKMWQENVEYNGKTLKRFEYVGEFTDKM